MLEHVHPDILKKLNTQVCPFSLLRKPALLLSKRCFEKRELLNTN
jgi:hypothetical protein